MPPVVAPPHSSAWWLIASNLLLGIGLAISFYDRIRFRKTMSALERQVKEAQAEAKGQTLLGVKLTEAPEVLVHYAREDAETLTFTNEGKSLAIGLSLGPLTWTEIRRLTLIREIPPLPIHHREVTEILFESAPGHGTPLKDFLRSTPANTETRITVNYRDLKGNPYARDFTLKIFPDNSVTWNPEPVRLQQPSRESS
jgi:hypothetical protein